MKKEYDINEVIRLRDEEKLQWKQIEEQIGVSSETLRKTYKRTKEGLSAKEANPNNVVNQKLRGLKRKYSAILERGGQCQKCGYHQNLSALEFHHRNPEEKEFQIDLRAFANTSIEKLKIELDKCDLLCSNCHAEHHHPEYDINNIENLLKEIESNRIDFTKEKNPKHICPICGTPFKSSGGKIYCSEECRWKAKGYPSIEEVNEQYSILKNWEKVAQHFGLTRSIIRGIRERNS